jgi:hypothetical protein
MPGASNVLIDPRKLQYLLTTSKAGFFLSHGFDATYPHELDAALRAHPASNEVEKFEYSLHGSKYVIRAALRSPDGRNPHARSVWIFDAGATFARFVTAYAIQKAPGAT